MSNINTAHIKTHTVQRYRGSVMTPGTPNSSFTTPSMSLRHSPSLYCLLSFLYHPYMLSLIHRIFDLLVINHGELVFINPRRACAARVTVLGLCVCLSVSILALQAAMQLMSDTNSCSTSALKIKQAILLKRGVRDRITGIVKDHVARPSPSISGVSMRVRKYQRPCPALFFSTLRIYLWPPLASFTLPFATSCPAQRGKADVQSGLPADAASLRETGSVDRYTPRGPVSHRIVAVQCLVSLILSLMAPRVCTLVLSSIQYKVSGGTIDPPTQGDTNKH